MKRLNTAPHWFVSCLLVAACSSTPSSSAAESTAHDASSDPSANGSSAGGSSTAASSASASASAADSNAGESAASDDGATACEGDAQVVNLTTTDGVRLEADFYPAGEGDKAALLLHMIPPGNDRSNYPPVFIRALNDAGYAVLNLDRRGAGGSEGDPSAAYEGPAGRLDAVAGLAALQESACRIAPSSVVIIGASNGTTTALDYTVDSSVAEQDRPRALVFLSPGSYTENQNTMAEHASTLAAMRVFFGYPDSERAWPEGVRELDGGSWAFKEYAGGGHGARLFDSSPQVLGDIIAFLEQ